MFEILAETWCIPLYY